jgi:hypothetical protein
MRFLKRKINATLARIASKQEKPIVNNNLSKWSTKKSLITEEESVLRKPIQKRLSKNALRKISLVNKNVVKNYGRAIANFASSEVALPYLDRYEEISKIDRKVFNEYCLSKRDYIQSIDTFKEMLIPDEDDDETTSDFKNLFQFLAEVFMKYFSVNWIYSGKMLYKEEYLKFRGPLMRRIRNPEGFIFLSKPKN